MSRFSHEHPDDPEGAWDAPVDRADHAKTEAREAGPQSCRYCRDGHKPNQNGEHWIVTSIVPADIDIRKCAAFTERCPACGRDFPNGGTCQKGGCPMGGDF